MRVERSGGLDRVRRAAACALALMLIAGCAIDGPAPAEPASQQASRTPAKPGRTPAKPPAKPATRPPAAATPAPGAPAAAEQVETREPVILRVGPTGDIRTIAEAARLARDGDTVEVQAGEYRGDVAVWLQKKLTIRSVGGPAVLVADGHAAEGKGIWVIRNGEFEIEGFDFVGARVPSRNGAGIRFERGKLTVRDSRFIDNQMGLLTGNDAASELTVERCEFRGPTDGDHWYHNLYAGTIARLTVIGSWSHKSRRGHLLKSRARESHILYNRLTDEGGTASYELEFANGGIARVIGNVIEQSPRTDNRTLVSFGAEGYRWPANRLALSHNTVVNRALTGTFLRVSPGQVAVQLYNNLWVGPGDAVLPSGIAESGNQRVSLSAFRDPRRHDYRALPHGPIAPVRARAPDALTPELEYLHERRLAQLGAVPLLPGALQR